MQRLRSKWVNNLDIHSKIVSFINLLTPGSVNKIDLTQTVQCQTILFINGGTGGGGEGVVQESIGLKIILSWTGLVYTLKRPRKPEFREKFSNCLEGP